MGQNSGKWDSHYSALLHPDHYIDSDSYVQGVVWLKDCRTIEDWGCGKRWFAYVAERLNVISVDGSKTPFADKIVDLEDYVSNVEGIFMRSVAEHNYQWRKILQNLLDSFTKRAFVQFYTPMNYNSDEAILLRTSSGYDDIPELFLPTRIWEAMISDSGASFSTETVSSPLAYGEETVYWIEK